MESTDRSLRTKALNENSDLRYDKSDIPGALYRDSIAFKAYLRLQRVPANAPPFTLDKDGYPIVHQGEYICRMKKSSRHRLCGTMVTSKQNIVRHLANDHGLVYSGPSFRKRGHRLTECRGFYHTLMKDEEYEGKEDSSPGPERFSREDEDDEDEEEEVEIQHRPRTRSQADERVPFQDDESDIEEVEVALPKRGEVVDLTSSPEPENIKIEKHMEPARTSKRQRPSSPDPNTERVKRERGSRSSPPRQEGEIEGSGGERAMPEDDSDEDLELELKKTDLESKRIELQQRLKKRRKMA